MANRHCIQSLKFWTYLLFPHACIISAYSAYFFIGVKIFQDVHSNHLAISSTIEQGNRSDTSLTRSIVFIGSTLTTLGIDQVRSLSNFEKCFLMIYTSFGIPLTFVVFRHLSELTKYFIQKWLTRFGIAGRSLNNFDSNLVYELFNRQSSESRIHMSISEIFLILLCHLLFGSLFIRTPSFIDRLYFCFMSLFTIQLTNSTDQHDAIRSWSSMLIMIYYLIGYSLTFLWIQTVQIQVDKGLENVTKTVIENVFDFLERIGIHSVDINTKLSNPLSSQDGSTNEDSEINLPMCALSTSFVRTIKNHENEYRLTLDKHIQVNTVIQSCSRCNSTLRALPIHRRYSNPSVSSAISLVDPASSCEDEDDGGFDDSSSSLFLMPLPKLDQVRQRRATMVARTILNQIHHQSRSDSIDQMTPSTRDSSPMKVKCSIKVVPSDEYGKTQQSESSIISK